MTELRPEDGLHRVASDPAANIWVTASAGTGKTTALVDRIVRLLLTGASPSGLFAITFTRTAAAEMQMRVMAVLANMAVLDDVALDRELERLGEAPSEPLRARARALFLDVLDAPDGLQIRTIHAAAQSLLSAFPMEAGLPPRADPLDERAAARLRERALSETLEEASAPGGEGLAADVRTIAVEAGETALKKYLPHLVRAGPAYPLIGGPADVERWLRNIVDLPREPTAEELLLEALVPPAFDDGAVAGYRPVLAASSHREDRDDALELVDSWPRLSGKERVDRLAGLFAIIYDSGGKPRGLSRVIKQVPDAAWRFQRLEAEIRKIQERRRALSFVAHAEAWLRLGMAVAERYQRLKRAAAAVDFDDMVRLAAGLLREEGMPGFVARKLDRRITHVLVDEAQDTNRGQWDLIDGLMEDFDSGEGAHDRALRTRFVVGDFKQAIFRFQGTDPRIFLDVRAEWAAKSAVGGNPMTEVPLDLNFRSAPLVLRVVDAVLAEIGPAALGLPETEAVRRHRAQHEGLAGRILLLDPHLTAGESDGPDEPDPDEDPASPADTEFAKRIAGVVAALVREGSPDRPVVTPKNGPPRLAGPGDVLILVQARGDLMPGLVRALHAEGVPVAGVDRTRLATPLAVRDCLSLIRFVLQPADDLALAEVLTSPLGGLDHEAVRMARLPGESLWTSLARREDLAEQVAFLRRALARADFVGPHGFLQALLAEGARARFRARFGPEVDDGLDLLLAEALAFEADNPATLQGFLAHVAASDGELARDPDGSPGLVRIMTVHGAKGLEAPIVVLADALRQRKPQTRMVLWRPEDRGVAIPLIFGSGERKPAVIAELADRADAEELQEHLRLLYVALTRARQLLVVAGQITPTTADRRQKAAGDETKLTTWYDRIGRAMRALGATEADGAPFGPHLRLSDGDWPAPGMASAAEPAVPVPGWALAPPPPEPAPARPFTPSQPAGDEAPLKPAAAGQAAAAARGRLLHRLFERLPAVAPRARADVAMRVIAAAGFTGPEAEALLETVLQTLAHPELADLFLPQALAEAPVAGVIDGIVISGTVDRLLVAEDRVLVADFKTGATVPDVAEAAHPSHLKQMAAYRAVLRSAFPGRTVVAALVYTAAPKLLLLPDKLLDAHAPVAQGAADAI